MDEKEGSCSNGIVSIISIIIIIINYYYERLVITFASHYQIFLSFKTKRYY